MTKSLRRARFVTVSGTITRRIFSAMTCRALPRSAENVEGALCDAFSTIGSFDSSALCADQASQYCFPCCGGDGPGVAHCVVSVRVQVRRMSAAALCSCGASERCDDA